MHINSVITHLKTFYGCFALLLILHIITIINADSIINDCYIFNVLLCLWLFRCLTGGEGRNADWAGWSSALLLPSCPNECGHILSRPEVDRDLRPDLQVGFPLTSLASTGDRFTSQLCSCVQNSSQNLLSASATQPDSRMPWGQNFGRILGDYFSWIC